MGTDPDILLRHAAQLHQVSASGPPGTDPAASGRPGGGRNLLVMTMGALHEGHAALIRAAREEAGAGDRVIVTVFVNPLQFGAGEDLDRYPRTLERDCEVAERAGADVLYAPSVGEVYPGGEPRVRITAGEMGERLEGASRPGHLDGVLTVVFTMFQLTRAHVAFFGSKDAQQLAVVRRMVTDLIIGTRIVAVPTVREADGLALSSRNAYLSAAERRTALTLSRALFAGREAVDSGATAVRQAARGVLHEGAEADPPLETDYLALLDPEDYAEVAPLHSGPAVLAVAARVGTTRLIDNLILEL